jgi:hypothetical protein
VVEDQRQPVVRSGDLDVEVSAVRQSQCRHRS